MAFNIRRTNAVWWFTLVMLAVIGAAILISSKNARLRGEVNRYSNAANTGGTQRHVMFGGISFSYDSSLADEVKTEIVNEQRLAAPDEKPDNATPRHVAFLLRGRYSSEHQSSFFDSPEIHVYPISEYKSALGISKRYVEEFDRDVHSLRELLKNKPAGLSGAIPVLPWIDAVQAIRARIQYAEFSNRTGILFVTQYNIEPSLINNDRLVYIFQGLTADGRYYISATFPIDVSGFPPTSNVETFDGYKVPENFYSDYESNKKSYEDYLKRTQERLNRASADEFHPPLRFFDELIRSLTIKR